MDKIHYINKKVVTRQGFALMITLSVLSVIIALTMVLLSYFEEVQKDAGNTKALIQADIYYADITKIFNGFKDKKTLFSMLYTMALPLDTSDNRFSIILDCEPLNKGVNINWMGLKKIKKESLKTVAEDLFEMLSQEYNLEDPGRLQEMLMEEIGGEKKSVSKEQSRLEQKNGIITYKQFADIVSRYQFEVDDSKVGRVPWRKYFSFSLQSEKIDAEYSSPELISYLFEIELSTAKEWASSMEDKNKLEVFVGLSGGDYAARRNILADKIFLDETGCSVSYALSGEQYKFKFEYIQGEAKYFEFYGKQ